MTIPEVVALQSYVGTASPFNFNGLVRHTYLRDKPLDGRHPGASSTDKHHRDRSSEDLAVVTRDLLTPIAQELGARIEVVEMPPGPPVLQTMVAEVYGPDDATRRQVAARHPRDVRSRPRSSSTPTATCRMPYTSWRFVVDREKASRRGVSVETINRQLEMAMGGYRPRRREDRARRRAAFIYLQMPLALRGQFGRLGQLPMPVGHRRDDPADRAGPFRGIPARRADLSTRTCARSNTSPARSPALGAPIYGILELEDLLDGYTAPDGVRVDTNYIGPPDDSLSFVAGMDRRVDRDLRDLPRHGPRLRARR